MILRCTCENAFQDRAHGAHMRVHNPLKPVGGREQMYRCCQCLAVRGERSGDVAEQHPGKDKGKGKGKGKAGVAKVSKAPGDKTKSNKGRG